MNTYIYKLIQDKDWTVQEAVFKFYEEVEELSQALLLNDRENTLEEACDVIQSIISLLDLKGYTTKEMFDGLEKHNEKLENRGWDRTAILKVQEVE